MNKERTSNMPKQHFEKIKIEKKELEWLYVPDVVYSESEGITRHIQMIIPYKRVWEDNKRYPLVVFIPGAAWHRQEMYNNIPARSELAKRGFVIAEVQVRESDLAIFPAPIIDVKKAIRFIYTLAEQFHIDMNNIFIAGDSSGGHIAMLTGLTAGYPEYDSDFNSERSCKVNGIITYYAPTDMFLSEESGPMEDFLGTDKMSHVPERAKNASSATYVSKEREIPPILLFHGMEDSVVTIEHSRSLFRYLKECDKEVEYYEVEEEDHGGASFWGKEILDKVENFIKRNCK